MLNEKYESVYEFGPFRLESEVRRLTRGDRVVPLSARLLDILLLLVTRKGEIVTKEDLLREVWHNQIVEENNVAVALSALRRALGEMHGGREYIETVPKRGYRFVAKVRQVGAMNLERDETSQSIAVLPFANEGSDPALEYLTDGIAVSVIGNLSRLVRLRVMAFSTASRYKGRTGNVLDAGREMGVDAVLVGRLRNVGENLFVSVELVDVRDGSRIWGAQYRRSLLNVLYLQEEIALEVSENLCLKLTADESRRLAKRYTINVEAYHFYLKGRYFSRGRTVEEIKKGIHCFEEAIRIDTDYALAYAGLADSHHALVTWNVQPPESGYPIARQAALKALELDDSLSEAHASLAYIKFHTWEWQSAEQDFERALALNPNNDRALRWYSMYLSARGRLDDAITVCEKGLRIDPLSPHTCTQLARNYYYAREYDRAIEQCREVLDLHRDWPDAYGVIGLNYLQKGMNVEAIAAFRKAVEILPDDPEPHMLLGCAYASAGRRKEVSNILNNLKSLSARRYVPAPLIAGIYIRLKDRDKAFEWLEKAYEQQSYGLAYLKISPLFDPIRSDPRFKELMKRVGLK